MAKKIDNMYVVLKVDDVKKYLGREGFATLVILNESIVNGRESDGKKQNEYIVCNQDEPYAEKVWQAILDGEDKKGGEQ